MIRNAIAFSLLTGLCLAQDEAKEQDIWTQDFAAAKAKAKAEKKDLLVDFTGSDWCGWCIRLDNEVFSKDEFKDWAPGRFVLVKLDYPNDKSLVTDEVRAQNEKLQGVYSIQGFPTILLMDHDGHVYGQTGYEQGGPAPYTKMLGEMVDAGAEFKKAKADAADKKGVERAKALEAALDTLDEDLVESYHVELMKEICALDADNKAGLKEKYEDKVAQVEMNGQLMSASQKLRGLIGEHMQSGDHAKALEALETVIAKPANKMEHQLALFFKGAVIMESGGKAKDAIASLEAAAKLVPNSPLSEQIEMMKGRMKEAAENEGGGEGGGEEKGGK